MSTTVEDYDAACLDLMEISRFEESRIVAQVDRLLTSRRRVENKERKEQRVRGSDDGRCWTKRICWIKKRETHHAESRQDPDSGGDESPIVA